MKTKGTRRRRLTTAARGGWIPTREMVHVEPPPSARVGMQLDRGIRNTVERLRKAGVETCQSCEGGAGHCYPEPTIEFRGGPGAGWHALSLCLDWRLPVLELRRVWDVVNKNEPEGPHWAIVFRRRPG